MPTFFSSVRAEKPIGKRFIASVNLDLVAALEFSESMHPVAGKGKAFWLYFVTVKGDVFASFMYDKIEDRLADYLAIIGSNAKP